MTQHEINTIHATHLQRMAEQDASDARWERDQRIAGIKFLVVIIAISTLGFIMFAIAGL